MGKEKKKKKKKSPKKRKERFLALEPISFLEKEERGGGERKKGGEGKKEPKVRTPRRKSWEFKWERNRKKNRQKATYQTPIIALPRWGEKKRGGKKRKNGPWKPIPYMSISPVLVQQGKGREGGGKEGSRSKKSPSKTKWSKCRKETMEWGNEKGEKGQPKRNHGRCFLPFAKGRGRSRKGGKGKRGRSLHPGGRKKRERESGGKGAPHRIPTQVILGKKKGEKRWGGTSEKREKSVQVPDCANSILSKEEEERGMKEKAVSAPPPWVHERPPREGKKERGGKRILQNLGEKERRGRPPLPSPREEKK